ncbi:hypothetical protein D9619_003151 [Psilocybe cf. subviscida]|uniref:Promethin n=1 Tax=Psilocybe cf. subviscida TaxID=2480587 RepID=A0A8H5EUN8_9AGAR|nr:hypothetical protein D9619_003151 [Psilocybe cf. subviscida]
MGSAPEHEKPTQKDALSSQFNNSISMVQSLTTRLEHDYVRPGLLKYQQFFARRPLTAIIIGIFAVLSVFPVITFIGLSFSLSAIFILAALTVALCASGAVVLAFFTALLGVLILTFITALFLTAVTISSFSFFRFVVLLRAQGAAGAYMWVLETKDTLLALLAKDSSQLTTSKINGHIQEDESTSSSPVQYKTDSQD